MVIRLYNFGNDAGELVIPDGSYLANKIHYEREKIAAKIKKGYKPVKRGDTYVLLEPSRSEENVQTNTD